jgi:hypothetical protein
MQLSGQSSPMFAKATMEYIIIKQFHCGRKAVFYIHSVPRCHNQDKLGAEELRLLGRYAV